MIGTRNVFRLQITGVPASLILYNLPPYLYLKLFNFIIIQITVSAKVILAATYYLAFKLLVRRVDDMFKTFYNTLIFLVRTL